MIFWNNTTNLDTFIVQDLYPGVQSDSALTGGKDLPSPGLLVFAFPHHRVVTEVAHHARDQGVIPVIHVDRVRRPLLVSHHPFTNCNKN